jgi:two-component system chemotaxis response regulator CheB
MGDGTTGSAGRPRFDLVAVAASGGGPAVLCAVLAALPREFPAAVVVVQHRSPAYAGFLTGLLQRRLALAVVDAEDGMPLRRGTIHVAPAGQHLVVRPGGILALASTPPHQFARPSADVFFASAAECYGDRAIAVVLTGRLQDGAAGAWAIRATGGRVLVQDPATCTAPEMPAAAIRTGSADFVLPPERIAPALVSLVMAPGANSLFRVPLAASLSRARLAWGA